MSALTLSDDQANAALADLVKRWSEARGLELVAVWQALEKGAHAHGGTEVLAAAIKDDPDLARRILDAVAGSETEAAEWAEAAIAGARQAKGHIFDPLSLGIIGTTLVSLVLAGRVKKIGSVEFYKGVPKEITQIVKAAASKVSVD